MAFEITRFTIIVNAAGTGTWRMWNYIPSPESADDDLTEPGYFGAMEGHIHAGDLLVVATAKSVRQMAFAIGDDGIVAVPMSEAKMPTSNMNPMPQELPGGSQPVSGPAGTDDLKPETIPADDDAKEEKSKELAEGESEPETVQPPPVVPPEPKPPEPAKPEPPLPEPPAPDLIAPDPAKREPDAAPTPPPPPPIPEGDVYDTRAFTVRPTES